MKKKSAMMAALAEKRKKAGLVKATVSIWVDSGDAEDARSAMKRAARKYTEKAAKRH